MNQIQQIQKLKQREERVLAKAKTMAQTKRIKKHEGNLWCVQSGNEKTPNDFYVVTYDTVLEAFMCTCKAFEFSTGLCKHIAAVAIFEKQRKGGDNN